MDEELVQVINNIKKNKKYQNLEESGIKQTIILPIMKALGWNFYDIDEVQPEYKVKEGAVDYALKHNGQIKVFIEAKRGNENLKKDEEQLLKYAFNAGVKLAVLTNGIEWWFYLPSEEGEWEERKFYSLDLYGQEIDEIISKFKEFLLKDYVISDQAYLNAKNLYDLKRRKRIINDTLKKAWDEIISDSDERLIKLLAERTKDLCGYQPDNEDVKEFLREFVDKYSFSTKEKVRTRTSTKTKGPTKSKEDFTGKSIISFSFKGVNYPVKSWQNLLLKIINLMLIENGKEFDKVLILEGRKRPYFSKNLNDLRQPLKINNTDIYVETNLSANSIVKLTRKILSIFGYDESDLIIETK